MDEGMPEESFSQKIPKQQAIMAAVLIILLAAIYLSGVWKPVFEVSTEKVGVLIIGEPSPAFKTVLDDDASLINYTVKMASQLEPNPSQQLEEYKVVVLDQHAGETVFAHSVSRQVGEALENFVRTGGTLIVVMDSGIYRSGPNESIASDVVGWTASFGDVVPVECDTTISGQGSCQIPIFSTGRIKRVDLSHKIMEGIESAPSSALPSYTIKTFDVKEASDVIALIESDEGQTFPAILEKKKLLGKTIYFNYDPALTPGIWQNTLEYIRG